MIPSNLQTFLWFASFIMCFMFIHDWMIKLVGLTGSTCIVIGLLLVVLLIDVFYSIRRTIIYRKYIREHGEEEDY